MSFWGKLNKSIANIHDIAVNNIAPKIGKAINKTGKAAPKAIDKGAGVINKTINGTKEVIGKVKNGDFAEAGEKIAKTILTDDDSYKGLKIGSKEIPFKADAKFEGKTSIGKLTGLNKFDDKIEFSKKPLILDELNNRAKDIGDKAASIFDFVTRDNFTVAGKEVFSNHNPFKLLRKSESSLIGWRTTGRGVAVAGGIALISGTPGAAKQFVNSRQGTNIDNQPVTPAPSIPAYANNGGATGDLVFALNNLRHGGMM